MLTVTALTYKINNRTLVKDIHFQIRAGELLVILGANGAGKSSLLKMLSGENKPTSGEVTLDNEPLSNYTARTLACKRAVLNQQNTINMPFTVKEIVLMGRYPHYRSTPAERDHTAVTETMEICGITHLTDRSFLTLSGGEQQRVQFARVLAQIWDQPGALLLMDEPAAGLDLQYQQQLLAIAKALCEKGFMVVTVLHEINLAAQYADRILLLKSGRKWQDGAAAQVLTPLNIYTIFNVETEVMLHPKTLRPYVIQKEIKLHAAKFNSLLSNQNIKHMTLKEKYLRYQAEHPTKRIRDIADELQVSEAELILTKVGETTTLLVPEIEAILKSIPTLGYVMALTRNDNCVHERKGVYAHFSSTPHASLFIGEDIDLRLFLQHWKLAVAVAENNHKSLQFFDQTGTALHKIYLTDKSDLEAYEALVNTFKTDDSYFNISGKAIEISAEKQDAEVDVESFRAAWNAMQDTHEFFGLLKRFQLSRIQALRLAPEGRVKGVALEEFKKIIHECTERRIPIMIFVGNKGCLQIHTGRIQHIVGSGNWYNILDPEFNLHLKEESITSIWHVIKPTADGDINSLEVFDKSGELIVQFFGKRKPGVPELEEWRNTLTAELV